MSQCYTTKPISPGSGDWFFDLSSQSTYIYVDNIVGWQLMVAGFAGGPPFIVPTAAQLEKHQSLKSAWEDFLVIKKILGI